MTTKMEKTLYKIIDREKSLFNNNEIVYIWHEIDKTKALFKSVERDLLSVLTYKGVEIIEKI